MKETSDIQCVNTKMTPTLNPIVYKDSPIGKIPIDWEVKRIGKITKTSAGGTPSTSIEEYWGGDIKWMSSGELNLKRIYDVEGRITDLGLKNSSTRKIPAECILIGLAGQGKTRGTVAMNMIELCTNQSVAAIYPSKEFHEDYLFYNLDFRYDELRQLSTGDGGRGGLNLNIINSIPVPLPPIHEQRAIAALLSTWDEAIHTTTQLLAQKELSKKWLMVNLLSGKIRLKAFDQERWKVKSLEEVLNPISRPVPKPNSLYTALGIRSHGKGTFLKYNCEPDNIQMDTLFVVRENDLIVNITFAWEGAIAIVKCDDDGALVSHRFPTFTFNSENGVMNYFRQLILQPKFKYMLDFISPGGAGRNRVLNKKDFLKLTFKIPSTKEQTAIAEILQTADTELQLLKDKLELLKEQKKGLMQILLTGKKRLKIQ